MLDVNANNDDVQIQIRHDSHVIWVHLAGRTILRCCQIGHLDISDDRPLAADLLEEGATK